MQGFFSAVMAGKDRDATVWPFWFRLDRDDFRPDRPEIINDDLFHTVRAGYGRKTAHTFPHPALNGFTA
jgi:hypothetical protein